MSQSRDHLNDGYLGRSLHLALNLPRDHGRSQEPDRSGTVARDLDAIGHAVNVRHVPDFWKPCEDWTLD